MNIHQSTKEEIKNNYFNNSYQNNENNRKSARFGNNSYNNAYSSNNNKEFSYKKNNNSNYGTKISNNKTSFNNDYRFTSSQQKKYKKIYKKPEITNNEDSKSGTLSDQGEIIEDDGKH